MKLCLFGFEAFKKMIVPQLSHLRLTYDNLSWTPILLELFPVWVTGEHKRPLYNTIVILFLVLREHKKRLRLGWECPMVRRQQDLLFTKIFTDNLDSDSFEKIEVVWRYRPVIFFMSSVKEPCFSWEDTSHRKISLESTQCLVSTSTWVSFALFYFLLIRRGNRKVNKYQRQILIFSFRVQFLSVTQCAATQTYYDFLQQKIISSWDWEQVFSRQGACLACSWFEFKIKHYRVNWAH